MPWRPHSPAAAAFKPRAPACAHRLALIAAPACCCRRTDNLFQSLEERTLTDEEQRIIEQRVRRLLHRRQRRRLAAAVGCWRCGGAWRAGAGGRLIGTGSLHAGCLNNVLLGQNVAGQCLSHAAARLCCRLVG